jgi:hypothetical protein
VAGLALGLLTVCVALSSWGTVGTVHDGPWTTDPAMGSPSASLYTRAWTALTALLAQDRSAAIYFMAYVDSSGGALNARCTYTVEGSDPPAGWWSLTVYGEDGFLLHDVGGRYSVARTSVARLNDGALRVTLAPTNSAAAARADALPTGTGAFNLLLRLYNPDPIASGDLAHMSLPAIRRESCA